MGQAAARLLAAKGWFVGAFDVDEEGLKALARELGPERCLVGLLDVTRESDFVRAIQAFAARTGGTMDIMFNNAGIAPGGWFDEMPMETIRRIVEINIMGVIYGTRAALPMLKDTPGSLCLSVSSSVATYGHALRAVYSASKFAVKGLTESLGLEFERFGVRTADILPGCIDTPMLRKALAQRDGVGVIDDPGPLLPQSGPFRLIPVQAIADCVWAAYNNKERVHWYVPEDVEDIDRMKANDFAGARAETRKFLFGDTA